MDKQMGGYIQMRLNITIWICCLVVWDPQNGLIWESLGNKGAPDFRMLAVEVCEVG